MAEYYEILFKDSSNDICIKSEVENPTEEQVMNFLRENERSFKCSVDDIEFIRRIPLRDADCFYDMEDRDNFPVLGKVSNDDG